MKVIPLSLAESYVSHWGWWEGIRELLQNAVDTGDFDVQTHWNGDIVINSRGGKIPVSSLLLGRTSKEDQDDTIGKFGEGMKLAFLVLGRLDAKVTVHNVDEIWQPCFRYNEVFDEKTLAVEVTDAESVIEGVTIKISGVPDVVIGQVEDRFLPLKGLVPEHTARNGEAYSHENDTSCTVYVNGIFVERIEGKYRFDYNFKPNAVTLDRDRNTAKAFEVRWEASRLLMMANQYLLVAELAAKQYNDVEHVSYHDMQLTTEDKQAMEDHAYAMFFEQHGANAWPISSDWTNAKKKLVSARAIENKYVPVEVPHAIFKLVEARFKLDGKITEVLEFNPVKFLSEFIDDHRRHMRAKPIKKLEQTLEMLKILKGG